MPVSPRRRFFRGLLQLVLGVGGLGYMLSRRWRRAAVTFLAVLGCDGLVYLAGGEGRGLAALGLGGAFLIQIMSALDVWLEGEVVAEEAVAGDAVA